jgi:hypothetical protein
MQKVCKFIMCLISNLCMVREEQEGQEGVRIYSVS